VFCRCVLAGGDLDGDTAARAAYLYAALSRACHYHLNAGPTATELTRWLNETADFVKLLRGSITRPVEGGGVAASLFVRSAAFVRSGA
jgi:hypothetical protein